jgi:hypothetical protein
MKIMYSIPILISLPFIDALKFFSIELFFLVHLVFLLFFFTFFKKTVYDLNKHIIKLFAFLFFVVGVLFFFKK